MEFAPEVNFELISCTPDSKLNDVVPYREFDEAWAEEVARVPEHNTVNSRHPLSEPDERKLPPFPGRISHGHRMMYDSPVVAMSNTPSSVIDIGCGDGYGYHTLVSQGAVSEYFGMDVNPLAIENGRKLLVSDKHRMEQGDWLAYPEDKLKPADFTFCIEVIEHVPAENRKAFIEKLARFTKKNLFLSTPPADRSKHGEMTVPECLALLKSAGLDAVAVDVQWTTLYICSKPSAVPAIAAPTPVEIPKTTMLVGAYQRDEQLDLTLASIARQSVKDLEVLVLNDGLESPTTEQVARKYGFTYVFTGQRNAGRSEPLWRIPGFAFNIGAKMAKGDVLVLTCAELYHVDNDCLEKLITPLVGDSMRVCVANGKDDDMSYLRALKNGGPTDELFSRLKPLRNELPFLMALYKSTYLVLGGYDEDFVGRCYDDDDFTDRLKRSGHKIIQTDARAVHLWHRRLSVPTDGDGDRVMLNKRLFFERRGQIQRNTGREWGVLK
jgi:2-polyprenyl-3-methyl-5-hydroxy-6-metoxy-1,4-benzoquinol methylase